MNAAVHLEEKISVSTKNMESRHLFINSLSPLACPIIQAGGMVVIRKVYGVYQVVQERKN